ncbi:hypothetical protein [Streptomyces profundus]|uniref:hypothetical protein n=1 Tax=Streptomyces profundus TaxID=2867410 RepID=UPI001D162069|nr:hypothetical protein [Streptomyces sp. MA3_2.13]UED84306.1 hypothetical protein K4G22_08885 [Streptomyces sp. MA3_2.13]
MVTLKQIKLSGPAFACPNALGAARPFAVAMLPVPSVRPESAARDLSRGERTMSAREMAVAAAAVGVDAYATTPNLVGAGHQIFGQQSKSHSMWALRGLEPWSDPT